ncbi:hypothetical protein D7V97_33525 [Corallococcus sp. CA053C]|uniref:J domain-containing protein n=1 Tax=Corallococcus sp. CA053C TaxID=2316732 RepID=UPI000EA3E2AD|nr:J domain-containing protein [Corallococcus sp. CA053C]RKG98075.1 hypothetical protein D7V97_33525 [Corallococcus sp. CA053C]
MLPRRWPCRLRSSNADYFNSEASMQATQRGTGQIDQSGIVRQLSVGEVMGFIAAPCAVIKLGPGATPVSFHYAITAKLGLFHRPRVHLGVVDYSQVEWTGWVRGIVKAKLQNLAVEFDSEGRPPTGYYLFIRGSPVAFHSAAVDLDQDGGFLFASVATAFIAHVLEDQGIAKAVPQVGTWAAGSRAADFFEDVIEKSFPKTEPIPEEQLPLMNADEADESLRLAYELLGLAPNASEDAVRSSYRSRVMECHPDRAGRSVSAQARATERTAEVNAARDYIWKVKGYR